MTTAAGVDQTVMTGVWQDVVGQHRAAEVLQRAAIAGADRDRHAMSHAWLFTGPPGSGRSNAALAFAAALQCERRTGCGDCRACRSVMSGNHPDVTSVRTEKLSIGVDEVRELVRSAALAPATGRHQVMVVEDADRVTERGADALLKSIEEPAPRTVWILCAPTPEDLIVTIRSRCRQLRLVTPSVDAIADLLVRRDGCDAETARLAARASQGHIGRARALARHPEVRERRREVLLLPTRLTSLAACLTAAQKLVDSTAAEASRRTGELDKTEAAELAEQLGEGGGKGRRQRHVAAAFRDLEEQQKLRSKRLQRDGLASAISELTAFYRDVMARQLGAAAEPVNPDLVAEVAQVADASTPEVTVRRLDALEACMVALEGNVAPLLAVEALMVKLGLPA
ncbi:DNA polymerase III subunit delta' [Parenemella sanctibonifatiensis]|uniref:DNA polymerase III subunit delta n=1 Tax=Parenemella sanctibonifatiensis TaxID=2016505 RepID=A0A255EWW1_9ACTN|nr:DNA polymerase III subunit delta' [Parenemella sanctibonifatiensis]OYN92613.1 DNA polymerase III subunit delta' [Parenemella sanctibonifatiensis]